MYGLGEDACLRLSVGSVGKTIERVGGGLDEDSRLTRGVLVVQIEVRLEAAWRVLVLVNKRKVRGLLVRLL